MIKLALLGHGPFPAPSFKLLKDIYQIVPIDQADCLIVANYGKILKNDELNRPKFGAINIHGSVLPKYRGASPIQTALANGDSKTGITIIKMDSKVDHGPILGHKEISINPNDTTETLKEKMGQLAAPFLVEILDQYFRGELTPIPQNEVRATFTKKITTQDSTLSVQAEPLKLYNFYRAYKDEPGLFVQLNNNQILKIIKAKYEDGQFVPLIIQKPGKKPISYQNFLLGWRETPPFSLS